MAAPTIVISAIDATGTVLRIAFNQALDTGAGDPSLGFSLAVADNSVSDDIDIISGEYVTGSPTAIDLTLSHPIWQGVDTGDVLYSYDAGPGVLQNGSAEGVASVQGASLATNGSTVSPSSGFRRRPVINMLDLDLEDELV